MRKIFIRNFRISMKTIKIYLPATVCVVAFAMLFCGCSTTHSYLDYSSRDKFIERVNDVFDGTKAYITLANDSTERTGFIRIAGDTMTISNDVDKILEGALSKNETEEIRYSDNTFSSGSVFLKDKRKISADTLFVSKDSVFYKETKTVRDVTERIPFNKIRTATYKTYLPGIVSGTIAFAAVGWLSGVIIGSGKSGRDIGGFYDFLNVGGGGVIGAITGGILGAVFPHNHVYVFNPAP